MNFCTKLPPHRQAAERKQNKKIKEVFASKRNIDEKEIFGNPIYERLNGSYEKINKKFAGRFHLIIIDLKETFGNRLFH